MMDFVEKNKAVLLLLLIILLLVAYHFLFMTREKAAMIVYEYTSGVNWDTGYLRARATALINKKDTFKYKGAEYDAASGKKRI